jgi:hypothetical protein
MTPEHRKQRLGIPTASNFSKIVSPLGKPSESAPKYLAALVGERMTGQPMEKDISHVPAVEYGIDHEDEAALAFAKKTGLELAPGGFLFDQALQAGCSPDRLIAGGSGKNFKPQAVEIKCPEPWNHMYYLLYGPGKDYKQQVQGQMLIGGFQSVHFVSWACMPNGTPLPLCHIEVQRDETFIGILRQQLAIFRDELEKKTLVAMKLWQEAGLVNYKRKDAAE